MFKAILKKVVPIPKIEEYSTFLFVGPHPDDIEVGAGATVAKLVEMGKKVYFLVCTDGRCGSENPNDDPEQIVAIRKEETLASAKLLGADDVFMLPFHDGGFYSVEELRLEIMKVLAKVKPDVVFTADHTLHNECHPDHLKAGEATTHAYLSCAFIHLMRECGIDDVSKTPVIAYYYTSKPNYYVKISAKQYQKRLDALNCFKSQFPIDNDVLGEWKAMKLYFKFRSVKNGAHKCSLNGDAFRVLGRVHSHCAPEAENL